MTARNRRYREVALFHEEQADLFWQASMASATLQAVSAGYDSRQCLTCRECQNMILSYTEGEMGKATSIILGDHFDQLIAQQVQTGRYGTASEVVRDALRIFEERQAAIQRLNDAIEEGYASGISEAFDWDELFAEAAAEA
jgi:antitoxin ParD1/3/4